MTLQTNRGAPFTGTGKTFNFLGILIEGSTVYRNTPASVDLLVHKMQDLTSFGLSCQSIISLCTNSKIGIKHGLDSVAAVPDEMENTYTRKKYLHIQCV